LDSVSEFTRREAAEALGAFAGQAAGALARLRTLAENDGQPDVRKAAVGAVRRIEPASERLESK
jgi:HEAT repeat protein